jgi:hypothetical protein
MAAASEEQRHHADARNAFHRHRGDRLREARLEMLEKRNDDARGRCARGDLVAQAVKRLRPARIARTVHV